MLVDGVSVLIDDSEEFHAFVSEVGDEDASFAGFCGDFDVLPVGAVRECYVVVVDCNVAVFVGDVLFVAGY